MALTSQSGDPAHRSFIAYFLGAVVPLFARMRPESRGNWRSLPSRWLSVDDHSAATSNDIWDYKRCTCNSVESDSPTHTPHRANRFVVIRSSRAAFRKAASFTMTPPPVPKNISSGV